MLLDAPIWLVQPLSGCWHSAHSAAPGTTRQLCSGQCTYVFCASAAGLLQPPGSIRCQHADRRGCQGPGAPSFAAVLLGAQAALASLGGLPTPLSKRRRAHRRLGVQTLTSSPVLRPVAMPIQWRFCCADRLQGRHHDWHPRLLPADHQVRPHWLPAGTAVRAL
jgi:hypothetical protein